MSFQSFGFSQHILNAIDKLGYTTPSAVQAEAIPHLLQGHDVIAQAQTGTGKTASFALPLLTQIDASNRSPQAIILAPTRELAVQVAEAIKSYALELPNFSVLPIYGGQEYSKQLSALKKGAHVVVGTPGRVIDLIERRKLSLRDIQHVVLDEADEMLKMGFLEDVEWILSQIPSDPQIALFSATMPEAVKRIAKKYLENPKRIHIAPKVKTVTAIEQSVMIVPRKAKFEALARYLEVSPVEGAIIFTRTKAESNALAEKLEARGFSAAAINGDMNQSLREKSIARLKKGSLDILVATDVAARGIDVERVSHVVNYDVPQDAETYVHRVGRTGRAGRKGSALLLISGDEKRKLREIEGSLQQTLIKIDPPSAASVNTHREDSLQREVAQTINDIDLSYYRERIEALIEARKIDILDAGAALAYLFGRTKPRQRVQDDLIFESKEEHSSPVKKERRRSPPRGKRPANKSNGHARRKKH